MIELVPLMLIKINTLQHNIDVNKYLKHMWSKYITRLPTITTIQFKMSVTTYVLGYWSVEYYNMHYSVNTKLDIIWKLKIKYYWIRISIKYIHNNIVYLTKYGRWREYFHTYWQRWALTSYRVNFFLKLFNLTS